MNGEYAVSKILRDNSAVTAIVSTRVYLDEAPQGAILPYIIIEGENIEPFPTKNGKSYTDHDFVNVFPYAESQNTLRQLAAAIRDALDEIEDGIYNAVNVETIRFVSEGSFSEEIANRKLYAKDQSYMVRVKNYGITADTTKITADSTEITADNF